jgi:23S rRNA pseudouridine1911/1915/1917 synthase
MHKTYLAIAQGRLVGEGVVDAPMGLVGGVVRVKMGVVPVEQGGLPARTRWRALAHHGQFTLVACFPETGRQHQIRCHLDLLGHPIVGDKLYPDPHLFAAYQDHGWEAVADRLPLRRHALHAAGLTFPHPRTGQPVTVESPLPDELRGFLEEAGAQARGG